MNLIIEFSLAIGLLMASAFFSASETALVSLSRTKAKRLALKNPGISQALLGWVDKPHELLIVILLGNTLTVVVFSALMTTVAVQLFDGFSASRVGAVAWIIQTIVLVIFAEMAPKFYARTHAEKTSIRVLPWLSRLRFILRPILFALSKIIQVVTPKLASRSTKTSLTFNLEDLKMMIEEGSRTESVNMMHGALKIQDMRVHSIMTPIDKVDMVDLNPPGRSQISTDVLIDLIVEKGHTRTPIKWKGNFLGFIHSDDLLPHIFSNEPLDVAEKIRKAFDVPEDMKVNDLLTPFRNSGTQMAFIRNPQNHVIGIVTLEDVLEEITGEILDEFDLSDLAKEKNP